MINYLCTEKPLYIWEQGSYELSVIDYRKEPWYMSAYSAQCENDVLDFIEKVRGGTGNCSETRSMSCIANR